MSRRTTIWSAAALSLALALLFGAVLLRPALGADEEDAPASVITLDTTRDAAADGDAVTGGDGAWADEWDEDDEHEEEYEEDEEEEDDDD
jgi:hypothetical protein